MTDAKSTLQLRIARYEKCPELDFFRVHCDENEAGWCQCVAWYVPWDGFSDRSKQDNLALRKELIDKGEFDGYLLYVEGEPAGWAQVVERDKLPKLREQFNLEPDEDTWAVSCFVIAPRFRGKGLATFMLLQILTDLRRRGAKRVEAYPKRGAEDPSDLWTGPESMYQAAGFKVGHKDPYQPVMVLELGEDD